MSTGPQLSIFYPAHNEAENLPSLIENASHFVAKQSFPVEVIVVDDGSKDNSKEVLEGLCERYKFLRFVRHEVNRGYGGALRSGFAAAKAPLIFFTDGDNQFRLDELNDFLVTLKQSGADVVVGYRVNRQDHFMRKVNTFLWGSLVKLLLRVKVRDIDCAYKLFKRESIAALNFTTTGAMISTELLFNLQRHHFKIEELPVRHYPRTQGNPTGAKLTVIARAFRELFAFYWRSR
jgi:glycosyltransferase involved in cell wall biosynthesis